MFLTTILLFFGAVTGSLIREQGVGMALMFWAIVVFLLVFVGGIMLWVNG